MDHLTATLCTRNEHKRRELERALPGWTIELLAATNYPAETGVTFYENALAKARFGRRVGPAGDWMLGEDSGLELRAFDGAPGIETARWANGCHVERALAALEHVDNRAARYVCALVALSPDGREARGTGTLDGTMAFEPRGTEGFGFDPLFVPLGETQTVAELGADWKAEHSHRALAARSLRVALPSSATAGERGAE